jgi:uncharacterized protein involved in exopolysaccharide biosynthesis
MNENNNQESEISLIDIFEFLQESWKTIAGFTVLGIAGAAFYLSVVPKQYEATAQIVMAQIGANNNNNNNMTPLGINIEEPALLIARLNMPTSFTAQEIAACGFEGRPEAGAALAKAIKVVPPKGIPNVVELKTNGNSPQLAKDCAAAIFELIKTTQNQLVIPYIEEAQLKLADDEKRLANAKDIVAKADKLGSAMGAAYLSTRDEIRFLLDQITALKSVVSSNQNRVTRLVATIYASEAPIAPKKRNILAAGLLGGLFLGLLMTLGRKVIAKMKDEMRGVL